MATVVAVADPDEDTVEQARATIWYFSHLRDKGIAQASRRCAMPCSRRQWGRVAVSGAPRESR
jgi:hypothetical protein